MNGSDVIVRAKIAALLLAADKIIDLSRQVPLPDRESRTRALREKEQWERALELAIVEYDAIKYG